MSPVDEAVRKGPAHSKFDQILQYVKRGREEGRLEAWSWGLLGTYSETVQRKTSHISRDSGNSVFFVRPKHESERDQTDHLNKRCQNKETKNFKNP